MSPLFSIIIPTYNRAKLLAKAIESVLQQTCNNFELIIVDDGSTDDTRDVVFSFEDKRIVYRHQQNKELSAARNTGVRISNGQYVCFLDDDDSYLETHLQVLKNAIDELKNTHTIFRTSLLIRNNGNEKKGVEFQGKDPPLKFVWDQFVGITTFCFPKEIFDTFLFPEEYLLFEDKHFLARVLLEYPFLQIKNASTVVYNIYDESRSFTAYKDDNRLKNQVDCIEDLFNKNGAEIKEVLGAKAKEKKISDFYYQAAQQALRVGDQIYTLKRLKQAAQYDNGLIRRLKYLKVRLKVLRG